MYFDQPTHACACVHMVENDKKHSKMMKRMSVGRPPLCMLYFLCLWKNMLKPLKKMISTSGPHSKDHVHVKIHSKGLF